MSSPRDRLMGLLAAQLGLVPAREVAGLVRRAAGASEPLDVTLVRERHLAAADVELLQRCVERTVALHGTDAKALAALPLGVQAATESFGGFDDTYDSGEHAISSSFESLEVVVAEMPGRYLPEARGELGRGGIGRVLSVKDQVLGRSVALKELLSQPLANPALDTRISGLAESRFLREARLAAQLEHPNIVPVYEAGRRADGALYLTMRRIEGRTLAQAFQGAPEREARLALLPHLLAVAQALAYAHSRQVIHRDVKPQNVMLGSFGETYLLDWGLARVKGRSDPRATELALAPDITGELRLAAVGTPSYMSPEQARGKVEELDERTDVWGLGAVLYELLTGRPPYVGTSALDCVQKILTEDFPPPDSLAPDAPPDLLAVCAKALAREPAGRYPTAGALAKDLERWVQGRTVSAREYGALELAVRFVRRHRVAAGLVSGLVAALLVVSGVSWWRVTVERNEARALSRFVLNELTEKLGSIPGADALLSTVSTPALDFYLSEGRMPQDDERGLVARTLAHRGRTALTAAHLDEARLRVTQCEAVVPPGSALERASDENAAAGGFCRVLRFDIAALVGDEAEMAREFASLEVALERPAGAWARSPRWAAALSMMNDRVARYAAAHGQSETASRLAQQAIVLDQEALRLDPSDTEVRASLIASLRERELVAFEAADPEPALAFGRQALELARTTPRRLHHSRVLRAWGSELQQHASLLKWAGRPAEAAALTDEGTKVFEQLIALEPDNVPGLGVYADFLLELGRYEEALVVLRQLAEKGARGDYLVSLVLAALAAGKVDEVLALQADVKASADPELHWLNAVALAQVGRYAEAEREVATWKARAATTAVQYPLGVLDRALATVPPPAGEVLRAFTRRLEAALREATEEHHLEVFEQLEADLRRLAETQGPDGGR